MKKTSFLSLCIYSILLIFISLAYSCSKDKDDTTNPQAVSPFTAGPDMHDNDNNVYHSVHIGKQIWTTENLRVTRFRNGLPISNILEDSNWVKQIISPAYCDINNNPAGAAYYGRLYNFSVIAASNQLCPDGWHLPSKSEWDSLETFIAGCSNKDTNYYSLFNSVCAGYRSYYDGVFFNSNKYAFYWSTTLHPQDNFRVYISLFGNGSNYIQHDYTQTTQGLSVRCVKD